MADSERKKPRVIPPLLLCLLVSGAAGSQVDGPPEFIAGHLSQSEPKVPSGYGRLPLSFELNLGQADARADYLARGVGYRLFLTSGEAVLSLSKAPLVGSTRDGKQGETDSLLLRMKLVGANPAPDVAGTNPLPGKSNYLTGNDPTKWLKNIPHYGAVRYRRVYPGVDLVYYGKQRQLEYDFVVAPRADPGVIEIAFDGTDEPRLDADGNLVLHVDGGEVVLRAPVVYQGADNARVTIASRYVIRENHHIGFELGDYDVEQTLTIDPILEYSSYLGGSGNDVGRSIAVDASGNAYVAGETRSTDFPTAAAGAPVDTTQEGPFDAFVTKLNSAGSALVYSTYLGGAGSDRGNGIVVDASGSAYVTGTTESTDFPTAAPSGVTPFQTALSGISDAFVTKLNAAGDGLVYSTYLGGDPLAFTSGAPHQCQGPDVGKGIALDPAGNTWVTGFTASLSYVGDSVVFPASGFPTTPGAFQPNNAGSSCFTDAFVTKLDANGSSLMYSTYLGGSGANFLDVDEGNAIAVDPAGNAYVTGFTDAADFPTTVGSLQPTRAGGATDAFVAKFDPTLVGAASLVYSSYIGGNNVDFGYGIAVDTSGSAYVAGGTFSTDFPGTLHSSIGAVVPPIQPEIATSRDGFVAKLNAAGSALLYSTYLGGGDADEAFAVALDPAGNAYVTGRTAAANIDPAIVPSPFQIHAECGLGGLDDAFVTKVDAAGNALVYSTYLGGSGRDQGLGIAVDASGRAYVTGYTQSANFPTENPFQSALAGSNDVFVVSLPAGGCAPVTPNTISIDVTEAITVADVVSLNVIPLAVQINVNETIAVNDSPNLVPAVFIVINEGVTVSDATGVTPPAIITVTENILVADAPNVVPPVVITLSELIAVGDQPGLLPSALIAVIENILVGHADELLASATIDIFENIGVLDGIDIPNTPEGQIVRVPLKDPATGATAVVTFDNIVREGSTTLVTSTTGPAPPLGFASGTPLTYYDISTTASFTDNVVVCLDYDGVTYHDETHLGLFHYDGSIPENITTSLDAASKTVCGITDSFSVFAVFEAETRAVVAVMNEKDGSVTLINAETRQVASTFPAGDKPIAGAFVDYFSGAPPAKLYVAGKDFVGVLFGPATPSPATALAFIPAGAVDAGKRPQGAAVSPDGTTLWVAAEKSDAIAIVDVATDTVLAALPLSQGGQTIGKTPVALGFSADGAYVYVLGHKSGNLIVIDTAVARVDPNNAVVSYVDVGKKPTALAISHAPGLVYVATEKDGVVVVDVSFPSSPVLVAAMSVGKKPEGLALTPDGSKLYVTNSKDDTVSVLERTAAPFYLIPIATIPVGKKPTGIAALAAVSNDLYPYIFVANTQDDTVSVIDTTRDQVMSTIPVGRRPRGIAAGALPALPPP